MALETAFIPNVAVLRMGKGFQGFGCPVAGCEFSVKDLDDIALAYEETRHSRLVPLKLGHGDDQKILESEGLPAAGWIENVRRVGTELIADFADVPRRIADLIRAKSYRSRSAELSTITVDGKRYRMALTAVALLGAELPAVPGLPDVAWFSHRHGHECACDPFEPTEIEMNIAVQLGISREAIREQKVRDRLIEIEGERQAMKFHEQFNRR